LKGKTKKLIKKLKKGKYDEKIKAADELGKTGDPEAIIPLKETLKGAMRDANVRSNLLAISTAKSLTQLGIDHTDTLVKYLNSYTPIVAASAAVALGELKRQESIKHLLEKVNHSDPLVRSKIVWALGEVGRGDKKVEETIRNLSLDDPDSYVKEKAQEALEKFEAWEELLEIEVIPARGGQSHILKVNSKTTIKLLKHQIGKSMRIKTNKIILSSRGRILNDESTLHAEGINDKSKIYIIKHP